MCLPVAAVGGLTGAAALGSLVLGTASSMAQYEAGQEAYHEKVVQYQENQQTAWAINRDEELSLTQRQMQEQQAYSQKDHMALVEGAKDAARVVVGAASGGVAGPNVTSLIGSVSQQVATARATLETNWQDTASQLQSQKNVQTQEEKMRINEVAPPFDPSAESTVLNIGGDAMKTLSTPGGQSLANSLGAGLNIQM